MTPKERAEELVDSYYNSNSEGDTGWMAKNDAKQCALIAVNEIIHLEIVLGIDNQDFEFWQQVKQEIQMI
jgi:hypothetical protein